MYSRTLYKSYTVRKAVLFSDTWCRSAQCCTGIQAYAHVLSLLTRSLKYVLPKYFCFLQNFPTDLGNASNGQDVVETLGSFERDLIAEKIF